MNGTSASGCRILESPETGKISLGCRACTKWKHSLLIVPPLLWFGFEGPKDKLDVEMEMVAKSSDADLIRRGKDS